MYDQDVAVRLHVAVAAGDSSIKVSFLVAELHVVGFGVFDVVAEEVGAGAGDVLQVVVGPFGL